MSDSDIQKVEPTAKTRKGNQTLVVILLFVIALLLVGVVGMFFYQQKQNQQFQRMQTAIAYFDKLEQEEKALKEQERIKAEQEKIRLALEEAKAEAKREAKREAERAAAVRAEAARKSAAQQNTYNPCKHVYVGKVFERQQRYFWTTVSFDWTVTGYSASSGKASVRKNQDGTTHEIYCSQIPG